MFSVLAVVGGIQIDTTFWTFITGPFVSLIVGVLAHSKAPARVKAYLNLLISAVVGIVVQATTNIGAQSFYAYAEAAIITWVTSISIYEGFWKKNEVAAAVTTATANFGVGAPKEG